MTIVDLITAEGAGEHRRLFVTAFLAGAMNTLVLGLVNVAAASPGAAGLGLFILFALAIALFVVGARHTYNRMTYLIESGLHRIRIRIVAKIERAELNRMERVGTSEVMDRLTENMSVISNASMVLAILLQSLCVLGCGAVYIVWYSPPAFALLALVLVAGLSIFMSEGAQTGEYLQQLAQVRLTLFDLVMDLLKGFKEIKFSRRRGSDIRLDITQASESLRAVAMKADRLFTGNWVFATCVFFAALGALVFVLPQHVATDAATLTTLVTGMVFIWGSISALVSFYPVYLRSNNALLQIEALEAKLDAEAPEEPTGAAPQDPWKGRVTAIEARNLEYEYAAGVDGRSFRVGPVSLPFAAGEVVFVVGGNGSGKSTFLKALTGLYPLTSGALLVDGILVGSGNRASYREMISAIYTDFHLFAKPYGLLHVDEASVRRLLSQMRLEGKTSFRDHRFTNRELSTGERKRLAMIVALLEDRPIYVFDEWAADQDPEFRQYFYEELIPELKQKGKIVIAVSHDDRYFRCADRVVTLEYGKVRSIERTTPSASGQPGA